ncbi:putative porin [Bacteroidia bacterium]|nr:putative porin [Bacteroidia bacterium]
MRKSIGLFILFHLFSLSSYAQILDTSEAHNHKPLNVHFIQESDILFLALDSTFLDTSFNLFYNYYPAYKISFPFVDQGLEASSLLCLSTTNERELKLNTGYTNLAPLFFDDEIHKYQLEKPLTRVNYSQGANEMIHMELTHAQQISERLTFGVDYRRIKNQSFYFSDIENIDRVRMNNLFNTKFYTGYFSKDRKYEILVSYLWNKSWNIESGGIASDSIFNSQSGRNKIDNSSAKFTAANSTQAQNSFKVVQYYRPGGLATDSTLDYSLSQFKSQFFLTTQQDNKRLEFEDRSPDSSNYGVNLEAYKDSIYHRSLSNEIGYLFTLKPVTLAASIQHSFDKLYMNGNNRSFQNVYINGNGRFGVKQFEINAEANFGILGYNVADYHLKASAKTNFNHINVSAGILSQLVEPSYTHKVFESQAVSWNNSFSKVSVNQLFGNANISYKKHRISGSVFAETSNGLIYFTGVDDIKQETDFVTLLMTKVGYSYSSSHIGGHLLATFQNSSNQQVLPRPATAISTNIYGQFLLFKKHLGIQLGARTHWFSSFVSPQYNVYTRQWHNTGTEFNMYAPINVYANAKVKSFCFGIEYFHIQQGWLGNDYYSSPGYPLMPRNMRLNIRWDLNN